MGGVRIEVSINIILFLITIVFIITNKIKLYLIYLLFIIIHELAHIAIGMIVGLKVRKISIIPFGLKVEFSKYNQEEKNEIKKILTFLAGPIINIILVIVGTILKWHSSIVYCNLIIAIFNLIPIIPLDGGKVLQSILNLKFERFKVFKIINYVSNICIILLTFICSIIILYVKNIAILFALIYLWYLVIKGNKKYRILKRIYKVIETN